MAQTGGCILMKIAPDFALQLSFQQSFCHKIIGVLQLQPAAKSGVLSLKVTVQMESLAGSKILIKMTPTFVVSARVPVFTQHHEVNTRS